MSKYKQSQFALFGKSSLVCLHPICYPTNLPCHHSLCVCLSSLLCSFSSMGTLLLTWHVPNILLTRVLIWRGFTEDTRLIDAYHTNPQEGLEVWFLSNIRRWTPNEIFMDFLRLTSLGFYEWGAGGRAGSSSNPHMHQRAEEKGWDGDREGWMV